MASYRIIGLATILASLPILGMAALLLKVSGFSISHALVIEKLFLGGIALFSAVLFFKGHRFKYLVGIAAWLLMGVWGASSVYFLAYDPVGEAKVSDYSMGLAYAVSGVIAVAFLGHKIWRGRNAI